MPVTRTALICRDDSPGTTTAARHRRRGRLPRRALRLGALVGAASLAAPLAVASAAPARSPLEVVDGYLGVVTTESPLSSEAGLKMLRAGGNAVDAAVAAAFARGVANFEACGIGGGGFLVYRGADGTVDALDFFERAPGKGVGYTFRPGRGEPGTAGYLYDKGRGPVGVPGFVRGMEAALEKYGTKTLAEAIAPAEEYARVGFPISPQSAALIEANREAARALREHSDTYDLYYNAVGPLSEERTSKAKGETLRLEDYAATLRRIAANGSAEFYDVSGGFQTATQLLASMHADPDDPTDWTAEDLETYQAYWRDPVTANYRDHHVIGIGANSAGGTLITETLNILEGFDLPALPLAQRLHVIAEAQRIAWTDRRAYYGDPGPPGQPGVPGDEWADIPPGLTTERYADLRRTEIRTGPTARRVEKYEPGQFEGYTPWGSSTTADHGTSGISVIDAEGNAVAMSCSIGTEGGSAVTPPGLGFLLNHSLGFDAPGSPNGPAAGKAPRSSQSPTIVVRRGRPVLAVAGQGGTGIPMGVLNMILQTVDFGASIDQALDAPRLDCCGYQPGNDPDEGLSVEARPDNAEALFTLYNTHGHRMTTDTPYNVAPVLSAATGGRGVPRQSSSDPRGECGPSSVEDGVTSSACYRQARADWLHWQPESR